MFKMNLAVYSILTAFSLLLIFWVVPSQTPPGLGYGLEPSFLPYILSTVMLVCTAWLLIKTLLTKSRQQGPSDLKIESFFQLLKYIPLFFITFPLMTWIGFIPASIIVLSILQYLVGQRNILLIVAISVGGTLLTYALILYGVRMPLP